MANSNKLKCLINEREFKIAILLGIIVYIISGNFTSVKILRLTPSTYLRQHFLLLYPANIIGIFGSVVGGPWAGLVISLFTNNPLYDHEVDVIVNAAQFVLIGYFCRKISSSWNVVSIPIGAALSLIFHPTLVGYFLYRRVIVYLYWETNMLFNAVLATAIYFVIKRVYPDIFRWATLDADSRI
ncbi:hypothetical protein ACFL0D_04085 [Thermoproteota archaeon]